MSPKLRGSPLLFLATFALRSPDVRLWGSCDPRPKYALDRPASFGLWDVGSLSRPSGFDPVLRASGVGRFGCYFAGALPVLGRVPFAGCTSPGVVVLGLRVRSGDHPQMGWPPARYLLILDVCIPFP